MNAFFDVAGSILCATIIGSVGVAVIVGIWAIIATTISETLRDLRR